MLLSSCCPVLPLLPLPWLACRFMRSQSLYYPSPTLPLQAWKQLWWAPALAAQINTLAPCSAGQKTTKVGPSTGGPNQHIGPLPLQARNQPWWAPSLEAPNQHTGPLPLQAWNNLTGPFPLQAEINMGWPCSAGQNHYWWPQSAGPNNLPLSQPGHGITTIYPNNTSMPPIPPPKLFSPKTFMLFQRNLSLVESLFCFKINSRCHSAPWDTWHITFV